MFSDPVCLSFYAASACYNPQAQLRTWIVITLFVMMHSCLASHLEVLFAQCEDAVKVQKGEVATADISQRPQER